MSDSSPSNNPPTSPAVARPINVADAASLPRALPTALPVPPREPPADSPSPPSPAGRWKLDPTMAPVAAGGAGSPVEEQAPPEEKKPLPQSTPDAAVTQPAAKRGRSWLAWPLAATAACVAIAIAVAFALKNRDDTTSNTDADSTTVPAANAPPALPPPPIEEVVRAIQRGDNEQLAALLARKPDLREERGAAALAEAIRRGDAAAAAALLAGSADANHPFAEVAPLMAAIEKNDAEMIRVLAAGKADPNRQLPRVGTPLAYVARRGYIDMLKTLLAHGAKVDRRTAAGDTPLGLAARQGQAAAVAELLAAGANANLADARGATPLMLALDGGRPDVVKMLLDRKADPLPRRSDGDNALSISLLKNQLVNYAAINTAIGDARPSLTGDAAGIPWRFLTELSTVEPPKTAKVPGSLPRVRGLESPHGVWLAPPAEMQPARVAYQLDQKFLYFQGFATLGDSAALGANKTATFRVVGDGKELWKSGPLSKPGDHQAARLEIAAVARLELFVDTDAPPEKTHALWFEPKVTR